MSFVDFPLGSAGVHVRRELVTNLMAFPKYTGRAQDEFEGCGVLLKRRRSWTPQQDDTWP